MDVGEYVEVGLMYLTPSLSSNGFLNEVFFALVS